MAVKQNADENTSDAGKANSASKLVKTLPSGLKNMDNNKSKGGIVDEDTRIGDSNNNGVSGGNENTESAAVNNNEGNNPKVVLLPKPKMLKEPFQPFIKIQEVLDLLDSLPDVLTMAYDNAIGDQIVYVLTHVIVPSHLPEDMREFKEQILKVGNFLSKNMYHEINVRSLHTIGNIITRLEDDSPRPSSAVAILFELFSKDFILQFVNSMVANTKTESHRRNFVQLLCQWLINCNFCTKLHFWIASFIAHYRNRFELCELIADDNIDRLIGALMMPSLRPKVTPIIIYLLSILNKSPRVFHRIIPKMPRTLRIIHAQAKSTNEYAEETIGVLQQLCNMLTTLMLYFRGYDELYGQLIEALKEFNPSDITYDAPQKQTLYNGHAGLVNLGNTCYMNSVLQALANTKEFSRGILLSDCQSPILVKLQQQIALLLYSVREELTPIRVLNATCPPGFCHGQQQDSSEFLNYLLETLHEQERAYSENRKRIASPASNHSIKANGRATDNGVEDEDGDLEETVFSRDRDKNSAAAKNNGSTEDCVGDNTIKDNKHEDIVQDMDNVAGNGNGDHLANEAEQKNDLSTIEKTFTGKQVTTYTCLTCGWRSNVEDVFRDLQLSFPESESDCMSNYSVQDLLDYYCSTEKLDGENQYHCDGCKQLRDALRSVRIISPPKYLIITLKHFKYDHTQQTRAKLMHKVYHDEKVTVKICPMHTPCERIAFYDLYASVVHCGFSMDSGHYYTYASDANDKWFKFNDSIVTPSETEELHNLEQPNTPYILFYQMSALSDEDADDANRLTSTVLSEADAAQDPAEAKVLQVETPTPLKLEELPKRLQDYVNRDNTAYANEIKGKRLSASTNRNYNRRENWDGDDDGGGGGAGGGNGRGNNMSSSTSNCGENILGNNSSHFIY